MTKSEMTILDRLEKAIEETDIDHCDYVSIDADKAAQAALKVVCDALREPIENWPEELRDALSLAVARASADEEELVSEAVLRALADHLEGKITMTPNESEMSIIPAGLLLDRISDTADAGGEHYAPCFRDCLGDNRDWVAPIIAEALTVSFDRGRREAEQDYETGYREGGSSANADWMMALDEYLDIDVATPMEAVVAIRARLSHNKDKDK